MSLVSCRPSTGEQQDSSAQVDAPDVRVGAEVLADRGFDLLVDRRVGLITNHTGRVRDRHLVDLLHEHPQIMLEVLFAPEHGLRGLEEAGDHIADGVDDATGIPIVSLYGEQRQPPDSIMAELDVLVFDIQDVGARFYTYISVMGLSMQSAALHAVPFIVLDRPNPLGDRVEGPILETEFESFVGLYPIPVVHGKTAGGLARAIVAEDWLESLDGLDLTVVEVDGWDPSDQWPETGREWIPTSPNIPDFETALVYPGTCFFEGTTWSEGRGTHTPFRVVGYPGADAESMARVLNASNLPGVRFEPTQFVPESIPGMASSPKHEGVEVHGVRVVVTDRKRYEPVRTGFEMVKAALDATPETDRSTFFKTRWFDLLAGTSEIREQIWEAGLRESD